MLTLQKLHELFCSVGLGEQGCAGKYQNSDTPGSTNQLTSRMNPDEKTRGTEASK